MKRKYGFIKQKEDKKDLQFKARKITIPNKIDLTPFQSPVYDQGELGSCVLNALMSYVDALRMMNKKPFYFGSRLASYYWTRQLEGTVNQDSGCEIRDAIKVLAKQGCCPESEWTYNIANFKKKPTAQCVKDAIGEEAVVYYALNNQNDFLTCLASGYTIIFGIDVYESFESDTVAKTGIIPMPKMKNEQLLGGHGILMVGYDLTKKLFKFKNSWGAGWGDKGYGYLPFDYITKYGSDFWQITKISK
jgi:C1A family cysteine protease